VESQNPLWWTTHLRKWDVTSLIFVYRETKWDWKSEKCFFLFLTQRNFPAFLFKKKNVSCYYYFLLFTELHRQHSGVGQPLQNVRHLRIGHGEEIREPDSRHFTTVSCYFWIFFLELLLFIVLLILLLLFLWLFWLWYCIFSFFSRCCFV
jgi:hypothetical protein